MAELPQLNEYSKIQHFEKGLSRHIKTVFPYSGEPTTLADFIELSSQIDFRNGANKEEQSLFSFSSSSFSSHFQQISNKTVLMDVDVVDAAPRRKGPLSTAEKERRKKLNLCMYDGSPDHTLDSCPHKPKKQSVNQILSTPTARDSSTSNPTRCWRFYTSILRPQMFQIQECNKQEKGD